MATPRRCAIYTRKSSEEGLDQDFNSLHAQREACEAFIRSQRHEGWRLIDTAYDDGGISGGTMDRPALQRLLDDIRADRVDIIVVYKVDRLTRSLADFAKMVELFDAHGVSFVAVTQQFNTTSSMGRLTLNVLLSFAQFEREVTGERIRDKIAASKRKGMWMGGNVPLGYDVRDRKLVINPAEAKTVQLIFRRYVELGSVRRLQETLDSDKIVSKHRIATSGNVSGGRPFSRGALYQLLSNAIYLGEIPHKGICHPGQHEAIVDRELWQAVQQRIRSNGVERGGRHGKTAPSPLAGKLFDTAGGRLTPTHAVKHGRRYRYYVSRSLMAGSAEQSGLRLPARDLEQSVATAAREILGDRTALTAALQEAGIGIGEVHSMLEAAAKLGQQLLSENQRTTLLPTLIERAEVRPDSLAIALSLRMLLPKELRTEAPVIRREVPMQCKRRGVEVRLIIGAAGAATRQVDAALLKTIARARCWFDELATGRVVSILEIARREAVSAQYIGGLLPLAFLAPEIVEAVGEGRQPVDCTAKAMIKRGPALPLAWAAQKQDLGFR